MLQTISQVARRMNRYAAAAEATAQWAERVFRDNLVAVVHFGSSARRIRFHRPRDIDIAVIVDVTQTAQEALKPPTTDPPTHLHVRTPAEIVGARDGVRAAIAHGRFEKRDATDYNKVRIRIHSRSTR